MSRWSTFQVKNSDELLNFLIKYAEESQIKMAKLAKVKVKTAVSRRTAPSGTLIQGNFPIGEYEMLVSEPENKALNNIMYVWRQFTYQSATWWSATGTPTVPDNWIEVEFLPEVPVEPEPPVELPPASKADLIEVYERLINSARIYKDLAEKIEQQAGLAKLYTIEFIEDTEMLLDTLREEL